MEMVGEGQHLTRLGEAHVGPSECTEPLVVRSCQGSTNSAQSGSRTCKSPPLFDQWDLSSPALVPLITLALDTVGNHRTQLNMFHMDDERLASIKHPAMLFPHLRSFSVNDQ